MTSRRKILAIGGSIGVGSSILYKFDTIATKGLEIVDFTTDRTVLGGISYNIEVRNLNPISSSEARLIAGAEFNDGSAVRDSKKIEVGSLSTKTFEIILSPDLDNRIDSGAYSPNVYIENI